MLFTRNVSPAPRKNGNVCLKECEKGKGKRHAKGEWKATFRYINKETDGEKLPCYFSNSIVFPPDIITELWYRNSTFCKSNKTVRKHKC